ncbi:MAG TPA: hypothetical protein VF789_04115 [Thermoanaerobaculia bacterium]
MKTSFPFLCAALSLAVTAGAQQAPAPPAAPPSPSPQAQPAAPPPPPPRCEGPEYRQFDFWLGSWTVLNPKDLPAGLSEITRVSSGCAIQEKWQGTMGGDGSSLSYFSRGDKSWHQVWVGPDGMVLHLKGGLQDGAMVLAGDDRQTPQGVVRDRIRWTPQPDGMVLQEWESSKDGGKTWQKSFSGRYRKR